jgi:hypothetical protein
VKRHWPILLSLALLGGCVQRKLTVQSDPPGALVYLNDQEIGRTPFTRDFTWYGAYEVAVRKDGYQPLLTRDTIVAPWWQWVPIDFAAEFLPLTDHRTMSFALKPATTQPTDTADLLARAHQAQQLLQSPSK